MENLNKNLPNFLSFYENSDFGIQQKVRFFYRLCQVILLFLVLIIFYTGYIQTISPDYGGLYLPVLLSPVIMCFVVMISLSLLKRGYFIVSAHILLNMSFCAIWAVMFLDKSGTLPRLDSIVIIPAILAMLPLIVKRARLSFIIYTGINILLLVAFLIINHQQMDVPFSYIIDYFSDTVIAMIFVGIVGYNILKISRRSLERTIIDIRERHEAEKALMESENKYHETLDLLPQTVFEADINGLLVYVNKKAFEVFGYDKEDLRRGLKMFEMIIESERKGASENVQRLMQNEGKEGVVYTALRKDGTTFPIRIYTGLIRINSKIRGFRGIVVDLTQQVESDKIIRESELSYRKNLEIQVSLRTEELASANHELQNSNEELLREREKLKEVLYDLQKAQNQLVHSKKMASLGILAAGVAHEINNPLNFIQAGIYGLSNYFKENLKSHLTEVSPMIDGIEEGVKRAANIVTSLNQYSRNDEHPRINCNIHHIIDNCLVMLQNETRNRIEIIKDFTGEFHAINCNEGMLHQAILNILSNSVQAIEKEGTIRISTKLSGNDLEISVADNGCGIDEENLGRIFDPFFTTKETGKGTGLGLSITYNIIQELHGTIHCSSKKLAGTKFIINLPLNVNLNGAVS